PNRIERGTKGALRNTSPSKLRIDEEARDPPQLLVRDRRGDLAAAPSRIDPRELLLAAVLAPADRRAARRDPDPIGARPAAHRLDPHVGERDHEDERQREAATEQAAAFGFQNAEAREDSHGDPSPSRRSDCFRIAFRLSGRNTPAAPHGSIVLVPTLARGW